MDTPDGTNTVHGALRTRLSLGNDLQSGSDSCPQTQSYEKQESSHSLTLDQAEVERPPTNELTTVPDGGLRAWLHVAGAFFLFFNTFGLTNTFGIYQAYYGTGTLISASHASISWIGSIQGFLVQFVGALSGPVYDAGYFRLLITTGSCLVVIGQMMLSLCHDYYQVLLAQALCMGIGAGFLFLPCVALLSQYFNKRLAVATGIAACGSGIGGVIYPLTLHRLLPQIGFAWATRVLGFIAFVTLLVPVVVMKPRTFPPSTRRLIDTSALRESPYVIFTIGCFFAWLGLYVPFFYVDSYSTALRLASEEISFYTITFINAGSIVGRLIPGYLADRLGSMNVMAPACVLSGLMAFCLIPDRDFASLVAVSTLYGVASGSLTSLWSTVYIRLSANRRHLIGTRMGMGLMVASFALLLGTPIAGWVLAASNYTMIWVFAGLMLSVGGSCMIAARIARTRTLFGRF